VLIKSFKVLYKTNDLTPLFHALVQLVKNEKLACTLGASERKNKLSLVELERYKTVRLKAGEKLEDPPDVSSEYCFTATPKGLKHLREVDRPIPLEQTKWIRGKAYPKKSSERL